MPAPRFHVPTIRVLAIVVAVLSLLQVSAAPSAQYFCRMMEQVTSTCCCGSAERAPQAQPVACGPKLQTRSCCELVQRFERAAPQALRDASPQVPAPFLVTLLAFPQVIGAPEQRLLARQPVQARAPPSPGVPIFLLNCSLLT